MSIDNLPTALPHIEAGRVKALAVFSANRVSVLPDVPTIAETLPGYDAALWTGFLAPRGTPPIAIKRIQSELTKLLQTAEVKTAFQRAGTDIVATDPKAFDAFLRAEYAKWGKVVRDLKLQVN